MNEVQPAPDPRHLLEEARSWPLLEKLMDECNGALHPKIDRGDEDVLLPSEVKAIAEKLGGKYDSGGMGIAYALFPTGSPHLVLTVGADEATGIALFYAPDVDGRDDPYMVEADCQWMWSLAGPPFFADDQEGGPGGPNPSWRLGIRPA
jgi:hypothetical protein